MRPSPTLLITRDLRVVLPCPTLEDAETLRRRLASLDRRSEPILAIDWDELELT